MDFSLSSLSWRRYDWISHWKLKCTKNKPTVGSRVVSSSDFIHRLEELARQDSREPNGSVDDRRDLFLPIVKLPKTTSNQTFAEGQHLNVSMVLLPVLLTSPGLVLEVQVVVPLLEVVDPFGPSNDQSPDWIGLMGVVAADSMPHIVERHLQRLQRN